VSDDSVFTLGTESMKNSQFFAALLGVTLAAGSVRAMQAQAPVHEVRLNGYRFRLPEGFTIELAAGQPEVVYPICADFDENGRLYVSEASGTDDDFPGQLQAKPHRVLRLEDTDGDGRFDKRTVFADRMMLPQGCLWFDGSLYVGAPPSIWKLTDTNGDGVADRRKEWFRNHELGGCANGIRGPYFGPDGMIYWCKGGHARETYQREGQAPLVTAADHVFRRRSDGSGFESVVAGGMDNPVEVAFTRAGEPLFTTTQYQELGQPRTDGIFHAVYGGVYPKVLPSVLEHIWTAPTLMPVLAHWGAASPAGLLRYESAAFGAEFHDQENVFAALFSFHKVTRHRLRSEGATYQASNEDFLVCDSLDFHPTDVIEDADGSLLVIATGGWYRRCCPSSNFYSPEVKGAIYRIRRLGAPRVADPRGSSLNWDRLTETALIALLADSRPAVRRRATQALANRTKAAVPLLMEAVHSRQQSAEARLQAVWAATRIADPAARAVARDALDDPDGTVRQAALHAVSLWRDRAAVPQLLAVLRQASPAHRRAAAEALGRIGAAEAVPGLLAAAGEPADRTLEHSVTFALIEIGDLAATARGLESANPLTRRAAITALDQMNVGRLDPAIFSKSMRSTDRALRETAWWVAGHHPECAIALEPVLHDALLAAQAVSAENEPLVGLLARYAKNADFQACISDRLIDVRSSAPARRILLAAMARAELKEIPSSWVGAVARLHGDADAGLISDWLATIRAWRLPADRAGKLVPVLRAIGEDQRLAPDVRLLALAAIPGGTAEIRPPLIDFLIGLLPIEQHPKLRSLAAEVLAAARLSPDQQKSLAARLPTTGPLERQRLLPSFRNAPGNVAQALLAALDTPSSLPGLRPEDLQGLFDSFGPSVHADSARLLDILTKRSQQQKLQIAQLLPLVRNGDPHRGKEVFHSSKAACSTCHQIAYLGGNRGPALTQIGTIRTEGDLLESILMPSVTIVQGYEPWLVATKDGKIHNGLLAGETSEEIVLATGALETVRLRRDEIEAPKPSSTSIMPEGMGQLLTPREIADLVAFLKTCK
jgi:putative membrane-bound dehydrogenase-like protein